MERSPRSTEILLVDWLRPQYFSGAIPSSRGTIAIGTRPAPSLSTLSTQLSVSIDVTCPATDIGLIGLGPMGVVVGIELKPYKTHIARSRPHLNSWIVTYPNYHKSVLSLFAASPCLIPLSVLFPSVNPPFSFVPRVHYSCKRG